MRDAAWSLPPIPWPHIAGPLAAAEDSLARLDERLRTSPVRDGFVARTHFADACACLWLQGELVHTEDLVLHDAGMNLRAPTHELIRAHAVLQARRRIFGASANWALSAVGLDVLSARGECDPEGSEEGRGVAPTAGDAGDLALLHAPVGAQKVDAGAAAWAAEMAEIDALMTRAKHATNEAISAREKTRDPLVYDGDWDENARLVEWRAVLKETRYLPPVLAAAVAAAAWDVIAPLERQPWLGRLLASALLRQRGKTRAHLACLNIGLREIPRERRRKTFGDTASKIQVEIDAITAAAELGLKEHDRWFNARRQLERRLVGRRSTSKLPALIELVLATPIASAGMIAQNLGVTPRAAQDMVAELGLREATGRGRYRAWGIL